MFFVGVGGFIVIIIKDIQVFKIDLVLVVAGVTVLAFLYNSAAYARASYRYNKISNLILALPSNVESQVYMYLDDRSRLLIYTEQFYALFANFNIEKKNWHKYLGHAIIENENYNYKQFMNFLRSAEERNYKIQFVFNNDYIVPAQSVSYTHLDVYKRQRSRQSRSNRYGRSDRSRRYRTAAGRH